MTYLVVKYGGTSLGTTEKIENAGRRLLALRNQGYHVIAVTSAMAGVTDHLSELANAFDGLGTAEGDAILTTGEQMTAALLARFLQSAGQKSRSWMAWQLPIVTTSSHGSAKVQTFHLGPLKKAFSEHSISVIPGFQGINAHQRLTTLGRGGSDITALTLTQALLTDSEIKGPIDCRIYTDVNGIFDADPHCLSEARLLPHISHDLLCALTAAGAQVVHPQAAQLAKKHRIPFWVKHYQAQDFDDGVATHHVGTYVTDTLPAGLTPVPLMAHQKSWVLLKVRGGQAGFLKLIEDAQEAGSPSFYALDAQHFALQESLWRAQETLLKNLCQQISCTPGYVALRVLLPHGCSMPLTDLKTSSVFPDVFFQTAENSAVFLSPEKHLPALLRHLDQQLQKKNDFSFQATSTGVLSCQKNSKTQQ